MGSGLTVMQLVEVLQMMQTFASERGIRRLDIAQICYWCAGTRATLEKLLREFEKRKMTPN